MSNAARKHAKFAAVRLNRLNYLNRMAWYNEDGNQMDVATACHAMVNLFSRWGVRPCDRKYQNWMGRKTTRILHPLFNTSFTQDVSRYNDAVIDRMTSNAQTVDAFVIQFNSSVKFPTSIFHNMQILCDRNDMRFNTPWQVTVVFTRPTCSLADLNPMRIRSKKPLIETKENSISVQVTEVKDTKTLIDELIQKELKPFLDIEEDLRCERYNINDRMMGLQRELDLVKTKAEANRAKMEEAKIALLGDWFPK